MHNITQLESDLWEAADLLREGGNVPYNEFFMPVMGILFLRHAANRFEAVEKQIQEERAAGTMKRPPVPADYRKRRAMYLPEGARYDKILGRAKDVHLGQAVDEAMTAIEEAFPPLKGVLPRDYVKTNSALLENLMKVFNRESLREATGDLFGRIYEYFLMKFSMVEAHDKGEFFTPPSLVQTIVNVIEPGRATPSDPTRGIIVLDPACGSGGMFVQTSHFVEHLGYDTAHRVTFYGHEKTGTTIRLARMNLAVHGLEGHIADSNTYYNDPHTLVGKCDFVMANPPFNVDKIDAKKAAEDTRRLPFGLPGVNKEKQVSNGNYVWISLFWSYLNPKGRAGFVMSSQASSAGNDEQTVRRKIVETGDVDVMIAIRSGFFYTRTVPCELWHFDRNKPKEREDLVLMLDARNIHRKVTRKIYDFSPEQLQNIAAIVWLYRGEQDRYLALIKDYFSSLCRETAALYKVLETFDASLKATTDALAQAAHAFRKLPNAKAAKLATLDTVAAELAEATSTYTRDRNEILKQLTTFHTATTKKPPVTNSAQHQARTAFEPLCERLKNLSKQADLLYKVSTHACDAANDLNGDNTPEGTYDRRATLRLLKQFEQDRSTAVEQLKMPLYFHRQIAWLQDRFPNAVLQPVPGLVKAVTRKQIEDADWSLTPGRYVGIAPQELDDDQDFQEAIAEIQTELADLNSEASVLASKIQDNLAVLAQ